LNEETSVAGLGIATSVWGVREAPPRDGRG